MKYQIENTYTPEEIGSFNVLVLLKEKTTHRIILSFAMIDDIINHINNKRSLKVLKIKDFLEEDDDLYLNRLTRTALGCESIKEELRSGKQPIFKINFDKFEEIEKKMKTEELELILKDGLPDL